MAASPHTPYEQRLASLSSGKAELLSTLTQIDLCCQEFSSVIDSLIEKLHQYRSACISHLQQQKFTLAKEFEDSFAEALATVESEELTFKGKYVEALRSHQPGNLALFRYSFDTSLIDDCVQSILSTQILQPAKRQSNSRSRSNSSAQDFPYRILPQICRNNLRLYDLQTSYISSAGLAISFTVGAVFCLLDDITVLCVGGHPAVRNGYLLALQEASVVATREMQVARGFPGIISRNWNCYVFGGESDGNSLTTSSEKYSFTGQCWYSLPHMAKARYCFSPCLHNDEVFLAETAHTEGVLEAFSIKQEQFRCVAVTLPIDGSESVSFVAEGELVVITHSGLIASWRIGGEAGFRTGRIEVKGAHFPSNITPARKGREVVWVEYDSGELWKFNLDTMSLSR